MLYWTTAGKHELILHNAQQTNFVSKTSSESVDLLNQLVSSKCETTRTTCWYHSRSLNHTSVVGLSVHLTAAVSTTANR